MALPQIYEGTAEEIAEQLRGSNLAGRLKAIVAPDELFEGNGAMPDASDTLEDFLAEIDKIEFKPGKPHTNPQEQELSRLIAQKFARQGHTK